MRDDFPEKTKEILAKRVGMVCSNPECRKPTSGPRDDPTKTVNIGVGAHITAASPGGPRYDASLPEMERASATNGIWLCQNCAKLIDNDEARYSTKLLRQWKTAAEKTARRNIETSDSSKNEKAHRQDDRVINTPLILFIDDDDPALIAISIEIIAAKRPGMCRTMTLRNAEEGLRFLLENSSQIGLVILDMMMPLPKLESTEDYGNGMFAGFWVLDQAKTVIKANRIPIVIVSKGLEEAIEDRMKIFNSDMPPGLVTFIPKLSLVYNFVATVEERISWWKRV